MKDSFEFVYKKINLKKQEQISESINISNIQLYDDSLNNVLLWFEKHLNKNYNSNENFLIELRKGIDLCLLLKKFVPTLKGRIWYGNQETNVNMQNDSYEQSLLLNSACSIKKTFPFIKNINSKTRVKLLSDYNKLGNTIISNNKTDNNNATSNKETDNKNVISNNVIYNQNVISNNGINNQNVRSNNGMDTNNVISNNGVDKYNATRNNRINNQNVISNNVMDNNNVIRNNGIDNKKVKCNHEVEYLKSQKNDADYGKRSNAVHRTKETEKLKFKNEVLDYRYIDNIYFFLSSLKKIGFPPQYSFDTVSLSEFKNVKSVIFCIHAFSLFLYTNEYIRYEDTIKMSFGLKFNLKLLNSRGRSVINPLKHIIIQGEYNEPKEDIMYFKNIINKNTMNNNSINNNTNKIQNKNEDKINLLNIKEHTMNNDTLKNQNIKKDNTEGNKNEENQSNYTDLCLTSFERNTCFNISHEIVTKETKNVNNKKVSRYTSYFQIASSRIATFITTNLYSRTYFSIYFNVSIFAVKFYMPKVELMLLNLPLILDLEAMLSVYTTIHHQNNKILNYMDEIACRINLLLNNKTSTLKITKEDPIEKRFVYVHGSCEEYLAYLVQTPIFVSKLLQEMNSTLVTEVLSKLYYDIDHNSVYALIEFTLNKLNVKENHTQDSKSINFKSKENYTEDSKTSNIKLKENCTHYSKTSNIKFKERTQTDFSKENSTYYSKSNNIKLEERNIRNTTNNYVSQSNYLSRSNYGVSLFQNKKIKFSNPILEYENRRKIFNNLFLLLDSICYPVDFDMNIILYEAFTKYIQLKQNYKSETNKNVKEEILNSELNADLKNISNEDAKEKTGNKEYNYNPKNVINQNIKETIGSKEYNLDAKIVISQDVTNQYVEEELENREYDGLNSKNVINQNKLNEDAKNKIENTGHDYLDSKSNACENDSSKCTDKRFYDFDMVYKNNASELVDIILRLFDRVKTNLNELSPVHKYLFSVLKNKKLFEFVEQYCKNEYKDELCTLISVTENTQHENVIEYENVSPHRNQYTQHSHFNQNGEENQVVKNENNVLSRNQYTQHPHFNQNGEEKKVVKNENNVLSRNQYTQHPHFNQNKENDLAQRDDNVLVENKNRFNADINRVAVFDGFDYENGIEFDGPCVRGESEKGNISSLSKDFENSFLLFLFYKKILSPIFFPELSYSVDESNFEFKNYLLFLDKKMLKIIFQSKDFVFNDFKELKNNLRNLFENCIKMNMTSSLGIPKYKKITFKSEKLKEFLKVSKRILQNDYENIDNQVCQRLKPHNKVREFTPSDIIFSNSRTPSKVKEFTPSDIICNNSGTPSKVREFTSSDIICNNSRTPSKVKEFTPSDIICNNSRTSSKVREFIYLNNITSDNKDYNSSKIANKDTGFVPTHNNSNIDYNNSRSLNDDIGYTPLKSIISNKFYNTFYDKDRLNNLINESLLHIINDENITYIMKYIEAKKEEKRIKSNFLYNLFIKTLFLLELDENKFKDENFQNLRKKYLRLNEIEEINESFNEKNYDEFDKINKKENIFSVWINNSLTSECTTFNNLYKDEGLNGLEQKEKDDHNSENKETENEFATANENNIINDEHQILIRNNATEDNDHNIKMIQSQATKNNYKKISMIQNEENKENATTIQEKAMEYNDEKIILIQNKEGNIESEADKYKDSVIYNKFLPYMNSLEISKFTCLDSFKKDLQKEVKKLSKVLFCKETNDIFKVLELIFKYTFFNLKFENEIKSFIEFTKQRKKILKNKNEKLKISFKANEEYFLSFSKFYFLKNLKNKENKILEISVKKLIENKIIEKLFEINQNKREFHKEIQHKDYISDEELSCEKYIDDKGQGLLREELLQEKHINDNGLLLEKQINDYQNINDNGLLLEKKRNDNEPSCEENFNDNNNVPLGKDDINEKKIIPLKQNHEPLYNFIYNENSTYSENYEDFTINDSYIEETELESNKENSNVYNSFIEEKYSVSNKKDEIVKKSSIDKKNSDINKEDLDGNNTSVQKKNLVILNDIEDFIVKKSIIEIKDTNIINDNNKEDLVVNNFSVGESDSDSNKEKSTFKNISSNIEQSISFEQISINSVVLCKTNKSIICKKSSKNSNITNETIIKFIHKGDIYFIIEIYNESKILMPIYMFRFDELLKNEQKKLREFKINENIIFNTENLTKFLNEIFL